MIIGIILLVFLYFLFALVNIARPLKIKIKTLTLLSTRKEAALHAAGAFILISVLSKTAEHIEYNENKISQAIEAGFSNVDEYKDASLHGYDNKSDYQLAIEGMKDGGFQSLGKYQDAQKRGYKTAYEYHKQHVVPQLKETHKTVLRLQKWSDSRLVRLLNDPEYSQEGLLSIYELILREIDDGGWWAKQRIIDKQNVNNKLRALKTMSPLVYENYKDSDDYKRDKETINHLYKERLNKNMRFGPFDLGDYDLTKNAFVIVPTDLFAGGAGGTSIVEIDSPSFDGFVLKGLDETMYIPKDIPGVKAKSLKISLSKSIASVYERGKVVFVGRLTGDNTTVWGNGLEYNRKAPTVNVLFYHLVSKEDEIYEHITSIGEKIVKRHLSKDK